ncbi:MAG: DUF362 domain-containing protein [Candidatus Omnitrophica bacterium]|nr:DUF362 domain-containing protein [Candidatus Omnitrophota bacterium]
MKTQVSIVRCPNYETDLVWKATQKAIELLGGITNFIPYGSSVLVKPNLLMAKEPQFGITTHPEVVRAIIRVLKEIDCKIFIGDGPSIWGGYAEDVDEVYKRSGIKDLAEEEQVELIKFHKHRWHRGFPLTTWLDTCEYLVSVPKFKTHDLTILTGAIKNLFGLVSAPYKTQLHKKYIGQEDFSHVLVDIYAETKPCLTVVDGVVAMEADGPATNGRLRSLGLILVGSDGVAIDSILATIMGLKPQDIPTTRQAAERGLGIADLNYIEILGERLEDIIGEPFLLPSTSITKKIPPALMEIAKGFIRFYPKLIQQNCILCQACVKSCPEKTIRLKDGHIVIDYSRCLSCFCCQEVCPTSAIRIKKSLFAKILGL